jgi:hypothetical protein
MIGDEDDKLRSDVDRGMKAKALLENELLAETLAYLRQSYVDGWQACKTPELRESAWYLVKAVDQIRDHLETVLNDGRLADRQIEELVKRQAGRPRAA